MKILKTSLLAASLFAAEGYAQFQQAFPQRHFQQQFNQFQHRPFNNFSQPQSFSHWGGHYPRRHHTWHRPWYPRPIIFNNNFYGPNYVNFPVSRWGW